MKKIITCSLLFISYLLNAQAPQWEWGRNFATSGNNNRSKLISADAEGNTVVAIMFAENELVLDDFTLVNSSEGTTDIGLVKYNSMGGIVWAKQYGGPANDWIISIDTDSEGNIFVASRSQQEADFGNGITTEGGLKCSLVKFDQDGIAQWATSSTGTYAWYAYDIKTDLAGNIYLAGILNSPEVIFGEVTLNWPAYDYADNNETSFVAKFSPAGQCVWAKSVQTPVEHEHGNSPNSIDIDNAGNVYMAGEFYNSSISFDNITLTKQSNSYNSHMYVVKYSADGTVQWAKNGGNNTYNKHAKAHAVSVYDNAVYVSGMFQENAMFGTTPLSTDGGAIQMFIIKYNATGELLWAKTAAGGQNGYSFAAGSDIDANGNLYISGITSGTVDFGNNITVTSEDFASLFVAGINGASGETQWVKHLWVSTTADHVQVECANPQSLYIVSSFQIPTLDFGNFNLERLSGDSEWDSFIAKLSTGSLSSEGYEKLTASLWPNPVKDEMYIVGIDVADRVEVYNMAGQLVLSHDALNINNSVNLSALSSGAYIVNIISGGKTENMKIIKE